MRKNLKKLLALILLATAGFGAYEYAHQPNEPMIGASVEKAPTSTGLVGYWSFNDGIGTKATDFSGNGNTGTLTNGPTWAGGKLGYGLRFDGTNDYVTVPNSSSLQTSNATYSIWIKPNVTISNTGQSGNDVSFFRKQTAGAGYILEVYGTTGSNKQLGFYTNYPNGTVATYTLNAGTWYHIVGTYNGSNAVLYVNGTQVATNADTSDGNNSAAVDFGTYLQNSRFFNGSIDEARLYNRALTSAEILSLYQAGLEKLQAANNNGLVGYWSLDDGTGTNATDFSGNGNTGTLTNGPVWTGGKLGYGLRFDGTNDRITTGNISFPTTLSVCYWSKPSSSGIYENILHGTTSLTQTAFEIYQNGLTIGLRGNGAGGFSTGSILLLNQWQFICGTISGTTGTIYYNGISQTTGSVTTPSASPNHINIGSYEDGSYPFSGSLDEVRLYNRVLSAQEILSLYQSGLAKINAPNNNGLVGYWSMNDGSGTKATDFSGNGNVGTLTNGPTWGAGRSSYGVVLDGTNDYVQASDTGLPSSTTSRTVSAWYKTSATPSLDSSMVTFGSAGTNTQANFFGINNLGRLHISNWGSDVASPTATNNGAWHHGLFTYNGSTYSLYQDGVLVAGPTSMTTNTVLNGSMYIGQSGEASHYYFPGSLDEVRIYNRALSAAEVLQLYQSY